MKDIISDIDQWLTDGQPIALATVIQTWGSSPRQAGSKMAFTADGRLTGSVSGGCVEGAVIAAGQETVAAGVPQLLHFGVSDETAWGVGLACGGVIEVFVQRLDTAVYTVWRELTQKNLSGTAVTLIAGSDEWTTGVLDGNGRLLAGHLPEAAVHLTAAAPRRVKTEDGCEWFIEPIRPAPTLIIVGGVHIAIALTSLAQTLGFRTILIDPRRAFGSEARFPHVDQLIQQWPEKAFAQLELTGGTAVALLTHDPKIDDPALKILLNSPVYYIGALGSRKTQAKRRARLLEMGFGETAVARIHGPIGLDIGAKTPAEIALAVLGEIVSQKRKT